MTRTEIAKTRCAITHAACFLHRRSLEESSI